MIAAIELAVLARLKALSDNGALGFRFRTLATYPDNWEDYLNHEAEIACPAAWVVFAGWDSTERVDDEDGGQMLIVTGASFGLMVADRNMRPNEQYQRHGGADPSREAGTYRILAAAVSALAGQSLGLDLVTPIEVGALRAVAPTAASDRQKMSRFACELRCAFLLALAADGESDPAALEALHVNWDIPAFGGPIPVDRDPVEPGPQLPDDVHADATDHLTLGDDNP